MNKFDILIIGGGPIGMACGITAQRAGLRYVIIEKGCLTNSLYHYPTNMTFFSTSEKLEIGEVPFMSLNPKPNRQEALEYYRRVQQVFQLNIHLFETFERAERMEDRRFNVTTSKGNYLAKYIIVATGFYDTPILVNVPGEDLPKVKHYYNDPHYYAFQHVVIIGANNSAVDAALETWHKGAHVTMVIAGDSIGQRVKYWVLPDITNRISEGSIRAYFRSRVTAIKEDGVDIITPNGPLTLPNDFVLAMTGYKPNFQLLKELGIQLSGDTNQCPVFNYETMETNQAGIYLAGVVCGGMNTHHWFIENSRIHAEKIMAHIVKR